MMRRFLILGLLFCGAVGFAAEGGISKEYADAEFQLYKDDVFFCQINAARAVATNIGEVGAQQIKMDDVVVTVYDTAAPAENGNQPVKLSIASSKGTYLQIRADTGASQDIVVLDGAPGKPVVVKRFRRDGSLDATITCSDSAKWNNTAGILNGAGEVTMRREDRTLTVVGVDMTYEIANRKDDFDLIDGDGQELGGVLEILREVEMEIVRQDRYGKLIPSSATKIRSHGSARYDFDQHRINFADTVNVTRDRLRINSQYLNVVLDAQSGDDSFKELVAWSDDDEVKINGRGNPGAAGDDLGDWSAFGQYARYNESSGELLITDDRAGKLPLARLENHEIRNQRITYLINNQILEATGEHGEARLGGGIGDYDAAETAPADDRTIINFTKRLFFDQKNRIAVFDQNVKLRNPDLQLTAQKLQVDFTELSGARDNKDAMARVHKITATDNVEVLYQNRQARADRLEMTPSHSRAAGSRGLILLDKFELSGTRQPEIETPGNGYFIAKKITLYRYERSVNGQRVVYVEAVGPGSGILGGERRELGNAYDVTASGTIINFKSHMVYDQMSDTVDFYGQVTANSGEQVLSSYRLMLYLLEREPERKEIRRLDAIGNQQERVTLDWRLHHCEAARIVREYACGRPNVKELIMLEGMPNFPAKVWEENGAVFYGPKIVTNPTGTTISSIGAGELTLLDRSTNEKATVHYSGRADYLVSGENSRAIFRDNVTLRRADMVVTSDVMQADLVKDASVSAPVETPAMAGDDTAAATLPRRLSRVIVEGKVTVRQGTRQAIGAKGQVNINDDGDVMILEGDQRQLAEVDNRDGFRLLAPRLMVRETQGLITATGRGQVFLSGQAVNMSSAFAAEGASSDGDYKLTYGGQMLYNMPEGKITFQRDVVMTQATLQAKCDLMTIRLERGANLTDRGSQARAETLECVGNVYFNSFPSSVTGVADPFGLSGTTIRTRSANATYSASLHQLVLSGAPLPQILRSQIPATNEMSRIFQQNERVWIDTQTGMIDFGGDKQNISPWPADRPLIFPGERTPWLPGNQ